MPSGVSFISNSLSWKRTFTPLLTLCSTSIKSSTRACIRLVLATIKTCSRTTTVSATPYESLTSQRTCPPIVLLSWNSNLRTLESKKHEEILKDKVYCIIMSCMFVLVVPLETFLLFRSVLLSFFLSVTSWRNLRVEDIKIISGEPCGLRRTSTRTRKQRKHANN